MKQRLLGQETEYAFRYTPPADGPPRRHPGNIKLFQAFEHAIKRLVRVRPGDWNAFKWTFFTENGGAFNYENQPHAPEGGLLEGSTPECASPAELLLYQRAQERLLRKAIPGAEAYLALQGHPGELGLIKNCRDAAGHVYGAQENYSAPVMRGRWSFALYRAVSALCFVPAFLLQLTYWVLVIGAVLAALSVRLVIQLAYLFLHGLCDAPARLLRLGFLRRAADALRAGHAGIWRRWEAFTESQAYVNGIARLESWVFLPPTALVMLPYNLLLKATAFRFEIRRLTSFFVTRIILTGAGTLLDDGTFALSEKGVAIKRLTRWSVGPGDRALFDNANLLKQFIFAAPSLLMFRTRPLRGIFQRASRLQIGMGESNRAQYAEYLKLGATWLALEAADAGFLEAAPQIRRPIRALRRIVRDPGLQTRVEVLLPEASANENRLPRLRWFEGLRKRFRRKRRENLSALEIQKRILQAVERYVLHVERARRESGEVATPLDAERRDILRVWRETLEMLERDPALLIGRLDWITKRYLIEAASGEDELSFAAKKKIDLRYHELDGGYFEGLEESGVAPQLVGLEQAEAAVAKPSSPDRVQLRSRLIRSEEREFRGESVSVSWGSVRIGSMWNRRIIPLD